MPVVLLAFIALSTCRRLVPAGRRNASAPLVMMERTLTTATRAMRTTDSLYAISFAARLEQQLGKWRQQANMTCCRGSRQ